MKRKLLVAISFLVLLYALGGMVYYFINQTPTPQEEKPIAKISGYSYQLKANATQLMKDEFQVLKKLLEGKEIDEEVYAKSVGKLFIIDLYTLGNKLNKYDVGGIQYVLPTGLDNFKLNVKDTLYKYIEDNTDGKRTQTLPEVKTINVLDIEATTYEIEKTAYSGYKINYEWTYIKNLGYDASGELIIIKEDKYYYVAEKN